MNKSQTYFRKYKSICAKIEDEIKRLEDEIKDIRSKMTTDLNASNWERYMNIEKLSQEKEKLRKLLTKQTNG
jgi:hypothetical protein